MRPKKTSIALMAAFAAALVLQPVIRWDQVSDTVQPATDTVRGVLSASDTDNPRSSLSGVDEPLFPPLMVQAVPTARGFELRFDQSQSPTPAETASTSARVVQAVARFAEDVSGASTRYDAMVVRPATRDVAVYPLFEIATVLPGYGHLFTFLDDRNVMFVRPAISGNLIVYDLARLDVETGEIAIIAAGFWEVNSHDKSAADDFLLSSHYSAQSGRPYGKLMLTSFKGRIWNIDIASGEVRTGKRAYPAYGDIGSKPPRELVYPSPDLERFVYQHPETNRFDVVDPDLDRSNRSFGFEDTTALMDPGIVWSPDSRTFFLEYGRRGQSLGVYTDNGMLLFAQGVRFYDREGRVVRTLELPASKEKRMNVYGWADNGKVWLEYFRAEPPEDRDSRKLDRTYKLYDIRTGKLTEYRLTNDAGKLRNISVIRRHEGYSFLSAPFLLADTEQRLLWEPPNDASAVWDDGQLYMRISSEDNSYVHHWNAAAKSWEWVNADPGEGGQDGPYFQDPYVFRNEWLVYRRDSFHRIEYVRFSDPAEQNANGWPILPGEVTAQGTAHAWWENDRHVIKTDAAALRTRGTSRFGSLQVWSRPGEIRSSEGGSPQYYGSYLVEYADLNGERKPLATLADLALHQEASPTEMRKYEFSGFDVLLFQPDSFRFSKGFDGGTRKVMAFALTERGEAFSLDFQYALGKEKLQRTPFFIIDDNAPVERIGNHLTLHAWIGDRNFELALEPQMNTRTLTVVAAKDRSAENDSLSKIAGRYSNRLEQALGLEEISLPEERMDEKRLRALFTDQAWNNPGFQHLRKEFARSKQEGNPSRAFAWYPIETRFVSPDTVRFTFTLNLWYAIGLAAHLEAGLKLVDGTWTFHDLGTLETEKLEGLPGYNGLLIRDPLELGK